ncbi:MAG: ABC transporter ATP-binding protein [Bacilli bacterium]|jgi:simple sugar transport system ATP-binding protein|nr:ABC transporter ATP-binding protein [Bacilli bacterium]
MENAIEMINITKEFPGIKAVDNVTFTLKKQEIHALLGENGAGKSTLMSVLFGLYQPESGTIKVNGKEVIINGPNKANDLGIGMVHQHFKLVEDFSVVENIILGYEPVKGLKLDLDSARKKILQLSEQYHLNVDVDAKVENISVGMQQRVEILKMLYRDNDILIFDEPTAVLTPQEIDELMKIMKKLTKEGKSIILITHKLKEIKMVADRCTILRRGKYEGTVDVANTETNVMANMMVGREVDFKVDKEDKEPGEIILKVENLSMINDKKIKVVDNVSFEVRRGEIFGLAGIEGNGQTDLIYGLTGLKKISEGKILLKGKDISYASIKARYEDGMGHIPEDRHKHGLVLDFSMAENMVLHSYNHRPYKKNGVIQEQAINELCNRLIDEFDIRSSQGSSTIVRTMSGGNQQKVIVAREIDLSPDLLLIVQPTRGLDVGAIEYIHRQIIEERDKDKAILLVSLELEEILDLSDRIAVMFEGKIMGEVNPKNTNEQELGLMMVGYDKEMEVIVDVK